MYRNKDLPRLVRVLLGQVLTLDPLVDLLVGPPVDLLADHLVDLLVDLLADLLAGPLVDLLVDLLVVLLVGDQAIQVEKGHQVVSRIHNYYN